MDIKETREEIIKRSNQIKRKRKKRMERLMQSACAVLIIALMFVMQQVSTAKGYSGVATNYGTLVLGAEAGAYVLVGFICFFLGVLITLIAVNKRKTKDENQE